MTRVEVDRLTVAYVRRPVLDGVALTAEEGSWVGLIGPNGAGKTTLLRAVAGLVPFDGRIAVGGADVATADRRTLSRLVAYLPQRPVLPEATSVADYVLLGRTPFVPYLGVEGPADLLAVESVLDRLELRALAERALGSLSGGEVQRAVLARALAQEAPVLLLDEPTAALDVGHQQQVLDLIDDLRFEERLTVLSAMHDLSQAGQYADRLVLLSGGRVVGAGSAGEVLTEATIGEHFGATVRVEADAAGAVSVVPTRRARTATRSSR